MIPGPFKDIDRDTLQTLIADAVPEGKTIEYKVDIPGKAERSGREPLLAAVASFANTAGGDLLLGVEAKRGIPVALPGIEIDDLDKARLRLEHMLLNGLAPRLPTVQIVAVETATSRYVLVIRVPESWIGPHRVSRTGKFYGRSSAGRYELDVGELRAAFMTSEGVDADRIGNFRVARIGRMLSDRAPVSLPQGARMVLHVVPRTAFSTANAIGINALESHDNWILPLGRGATSYRVNLDGFVTFSTARGRTAADAYTHGLPKRCR